ncbi:dihydroorotate dehydrogenase [Vibrio litoralis]|uniref:dihydroorotate dehydrogenase n=1 Tax=Vibrio litoralis TaxID=335972 RepID=UPI00186679B8|nr:dihydroorotate dehydrogenase [Vibrio litoralis]
MVNLSTNIGNIRLQNPVMPASGCFSIEYAQAMDINRLGAVVLKSVSPVIRDGNPTPRVCEVRGGMMNSIGIPSKGIDYYKNKVIPEFGHYTTPIVASVSAHTAESFSKAVKDISETAIVAVEANISCPNLENDGMAFAMSADSTYKVVKEIRKNSDFPLWVKLTPNAANVVDIARAAEEAGADAIVMGNTILSMAIDIHSRKPKLGNVMGGLSGPAVKPIAIRMVHQCYKAVNIPIIGCGGITTGEDVIEFLLAGATAVQIGTASFLNPNAMVEAIDYIEQYCLQYNIKSLNELVGQVEYETTPVNDLKNVISS